MTLEQVRQARDQLIETGQYPSYDKVQELTGGSKRDVGALMRKLAGEGELSVKFPELEESPKFPELEESVKNPDAEASQLSLKDRVGPIWEPSSPLATLYAAASTALDTEAALAAQHQQIKVRRQVLDQELIHLDGMKQSRLSPTQAAQRREDEAACAATRREVEEHRLQVYTKLAQANLARRQAEEVYRESRYQTWALLRVMHEHLRRAAALANAVQADAAAQEARLAQERLAQAIGQAAAQCLANDAALQPSWPGV
jgi:hypothetical protein